MPNQPTLNPVLMSKFVLWVATIVVATLLLRRRQMTSRRRLAFLIGGALLFGVVYGLLARSDVNPSPPFSLRNVLTALLVRGQTPTLILGMLAALLLMVWVSNKSICGWGCQFGLLQDAMHHILPGRRRGKRRWKPPFWLSNSVRILAFVGLIIGLLTAKTDWISRVDPFQIFFGQVTPLILGFTGLLLLASLFVYRPWCQFLCPFGLVSWVVEQFSLLRPRVNRTTCKECQLCVKACPTHAMADFYAGKKIHADCFACGACIDACPQPDALNWER